jgi:hypothetical protein
VRDKVAKEEEELYICSSRLSSGRKVLGGSREVCLLHGLSKSPLSLDSTYWPTTTGVSNFRRKGCWETPLLIVGNHSTIEKGLTPDGADRPFGQRYREDVEVRA